MIDFELSRQLAILAFFPAKRVGELDGKVLVYDSHITKTFDFNNWSDLMPLVVEYDIENGKKMGGKYSAFWYKGDLQKDGKGIYVTSETPQRALAECLLKVLEAK